MTKKSKVVSCILAVLSGVCFVSGMALLTNEGSAVDYGTREETDFDD